MHDLLLAQARWVAPALLAATLSFASFASAHTDSVTVLHLTTVDDETHLVDAAPLGGPPSLGDMLVFSENLFRDGRRVGFTTGVCTVARVQHPRWPSSARPLPTLAAPVDRSGSCL